jgi:hypothetical protein
MTAGNDNGNRHGLGLRLMWFSILWLGGVSVDRAVAFLIRSVLL